MQEHKELKGKKKYNYYTKTIILLKCIFEGQQVILETIFKHIFYILHKHFFPFFTYYAWPAGAQR